jgi:methionyl-tRNA formyltransferase
MLLKASTAIDPDETAPQLSARLAPLGAELLLTAMREITAATVVREKQNDADATLAPILKKEDGEIDWSREARVIYNRLRGFSPWPGAYTTFRGQQLMIVRARPADGAGIPVANFAAVKRRLFAGCGSNTALEILELQLAGKKPVSAEAFLNGYSLAAQEHLGDPT